MKQKTQAIQEFLETQSCKADGLYSPEMEVQVNVIPGKERVDKAWTDGTDTWAPFRIPNRGGGIDAEPEYQDTILSWPIEKHAEGIGLTGWNWFKRESLWVGFDFDSIVNHNKGLTDEELEQLKERVSNIPWITVRRSKSGRGLHLYVFFSTPVPTNNHTYHSSLARSILSNLSGLLGFDFQSKVDVSGGVLWIWHRDASKEKRSFEVLKQGTKLDTIPSNWQDYVGANKRTRRTPSQMSSKEFQELISRTKQIELDVEHRRLLAWFATQKVTWWWDAERGMLVCHTYDLSRAAVDLEFKGIFDTVSRGRDAPHDQNCFCFPVNNGGWAVRRHGKDVTETASWFKDSAGWTTTYLNKIPDLAIASKLCGGKKNKKGDFNFETYAQAFEALEKINISAPAVNQLNRHRATVLSRGKDNDVVISLERYQGDRQEDFEDWYEVRGPRWETVIEQVLTGEIVELPDHILRHVVTGNSSDWFLCARGEWIPKNKDDIRSALVASAFQRNEIELIFGQAVKNHWKEVNIPFGEDFPGDRRWNRKGAKLAFTPRPGPHPHWTMIYEHLGTNIDVLPDPWCQTNNITSGGQYLLYWSASLFQYPTEPLPYLFLHSVEQNTGKSTFSEAHRLLFLEGKGWVFGTRALTEVAGYNGELDGAIFCSVEELNVRSHKHAADRIKDWTTAKMLSIRPMHQGTYTAPNYTHWVQTANDASYCPVLPGDTRITVVEVPTLKAEIPKEDLFARLREEAPAFLFTLLSLQIPLSKSRLRIPVIESALKSEIQEFNADPLQSYLTEVLKPKPGNLTLVSTVLNNYLRANPTTGLTYGRVKKMLPVGLWPRAVYGGQRQEYFINCCYEGEPDYMPFGPTTIERKSDGRIQVKTNG